MPVDYETLLRHYMQHVRACEGTDYVDQLPQNNPGDVRLTPEECDVLERLSKEIDEEG